MLSKANISVSLKNPGVKILLFLVWPVLGLLEAVHSFGEKGSKAVITLYGFVWGLSFDYTDSLSDGSRYAKWFVNYFNMDFSQLMEVLSHYGEPGCNDIYTIITFFSVSRFTNDVSVLFGVWGMVYFYFLSSAIYEITRYAEVYGLNIKKYASIFFIGLVFLLPLNAINGVRMWTAFMIFFTFAFKGILRNNWHYIAYSALSLLVHFSFMFPVMALFLFWIFRRRTSLFYIATILTFIFGSATSSLIESYGSIFSEGVSTKLNAYSDEEYVKRTVESLNEQVWYAKYRLDVLKYYLFVCLFFVVRYNIKNTISKSVHYMFLFALSLLCIYNLTIEISSSSRFFNIFAFGTLGFLTLFAAKTGNRGFIERLQYLGVIAIGLYVAVGQVNALRFFDFNIALGNIISIPYILFLS